jgi:hypothetical protein
MIRYLISYIDPPTGNTGNCELSTTLPISDMADVQVVTRQLRNDFGLVNPIVLGFSAFDQGKDQR